MADELTFSAESVLKYLISNGGKVSNHDLVKYFKKFLSGPDSQHAKALFKEYVNSVATMKVEDDVKYVIAKKRTHDCKSDSSSSNSLSDSSNIDAKKFKLSENSAKSQTGILHSHSSPSMLGMVPNSLDSPVTPGIQSQSVFWSSDLPPGHVPQPPPRRKHSLKGKENKGTKFEESIRQINEEKEVAANSTNEEVKDILSPGSVKEKANILNKMASEQEPSQKPSAPARRRDTHYKGGDDDDTCSLSSLDPRRKEWVIKSSRSDYHELVRLLKEEPKLAHVKDHNKYTALHWAAKHGNLDIIKLIAGTHKLDTNLKSSGGYTPLHMAAMFGHEEIMEVLINTYGADPSLRDYNGKRAIHYLPKTQSERFLTLFPNLAYPILLCGKVVSGKKEKEYSLMRMGSLNSKTKRTSVLSAGRALTRMKSWGSADNIPDRAVNLMPPPKTYPKKKKSRKHGDIIGLSDNWRAKSGDSDSDSASGVAS